DQHSGLGDDCSRRDLLGVGLLAAALRQMDGGEAPRPGAPDASAARRQRPGPVGRPSARASASTRTVRTWVDLRFLLVSLALSAGFVAMLVHPHLVTDAFPRALFVPILLGGWVIASGEVAAWSHRVQTPLLLILFVIATATVYEFEHFNDTRWVTKQPA